MATNPMQQFEVHRIGPHLSLNGTDLSFTNSSLFMLISSILIIIFFIAGTRKVNIVPSKIQLLNELVFNFISKMINETAGPNARPYFPFILTIFLFILTLNMVGLLPYAFTVTSQIIITFFLATAIFIGVTIIGFAKNGIGFLKIFAPSGVPIFLFILTLNMVGLLPYAFTVTSQIIITFFLATAIFIGVTIIGFAKNGIGFLKIFAPSGVPIFLFPIIVAIEIISFLSRPISLSVRLFANMLAGHTMLKVFGGFVVSLGIVGGWLPLSFSVALTALEILVAFLQAYVFAVLSCIYLNDALNMHH